MRPAARVGARAGPAPSGFRAAGSPPSRASKPNDPSMPAAPRPVAPRSLNLSQQRPRLLPGSGPLPPLPGCPARSRPLPALPGRHALPPRRRATRRGPPRPASRCNWGCGHSGRPPALPLRLQGSLPRSFSSSPDGSGSLPPCLYGSCVPPGADLLPVSTTVKVRADFPVCSMRQSPF